MWLQIQQKLSSLGPVFAIDAFCRADFEVTPGDSKQNVVPDYFHANKHHRKNKQTASKHRTEP